MFLTLMPSTKIALLNKMATRAKIWNLFKKPIDLPEPLHDQNLN